MKTWIAMIVFIISVYLFVTAPAPLQTHQNTGPANIPIHALFTELNEINSKARQLYTSKIVSQGKKAGLKFSEDWADKHVQAGPLPALFLRLSSQSLQNQQSELGLFLGSDQPINVSNFFKGRQIKEFNQLKESQKPQFFAMPELDIQLAMFADMASAKACVSCHNKHRDSPKKDWKLDDVMGATTWTYPRQFVSQAESQQVIGQLYLAIIQSYDAFLKKAATFEPKVDINTAWPSAGHLALPDRRTFIQKLFQATGSRSAQFIFLAPELLQKGEKDAQAS